MKWNKKGRSDGENDGAHIIAILRNYRDFIKLYNGIKIQKKYVLMVASVFDLTFRVHSRWRYKCCQIAAVLAFNEKSLYLHCL